MKNKITKKIFFLTILVLFLMTTTAVAQSSKSSLSVSDLSLVWESDTYTPPFYKGRGGVIVGSNVRVIALSRVLKGGVVIPVSQTIYRWLFNGYAINEKSGVGKNVFEFTASPRTNTISVQIVDANKVVVQTQSILIPIVEPSLLLYENSPLFGPLFNKKLTGSFRFFDEEVSINVYPLSFSSRRLSDNNKYVWTVGGEEIGGNASPSLTLRGSGEGGQTQLRVSVSDRENSFGNVAEKLSIIFGNI